MSRGLAILRNLSDIELIICSKRSFTGSQVSNSFCLTWALLFKFRQNRMHLFWSICNFEFNLLFTLGYQAEQAWWKWGYVRELQNNLQRGGDKNLFVLYRNLSLLLIFFITFKTIDSPKRVSSNEQPRYDTVWYCLKRISPY